MMLLSRNAILIETSNSQENVSFTMSRITINLVLLLIIQLSPRMPSQSLSVQSVSCLHPIQIVNRRYTSATEDYARIGLKIPLSSFRHNPDYYLSVPCGKCVLCRKKRANEWRVRLLAEVENEQKVKKALFLTFTFSDKYYFDYINPDDNGNSRKGDFIRRWRQNFKNKYGYSPRYFLIEDCGSQFGRIHLHGFLFNPPPLSLSKMKDDRLCWKSGYIKISYCRSLKAISYACGYITGSSLKSDAKKHGKPICDKARKFIGKIFVSKGLGAKFALSHGSEYRSRSKDFFAIRQGPYTIPMPRYLRSKIWSKYELDWIRNDYLIDKYLEFENFDSENYRVKFQGKLLSPQHYCAVAKEFIRRFEDLEQTVYLHNGTPINVPQKIYEMPENTDFDFDVCTTPQQTSLNL